MRKEGKLRSKRQRRKGIRSPLDKRRGTAGNEKKPNARGEKEIGTYSASTEVSGGESHRGVDVGSRGEHQREVDGEGASLAKGSLDRTARCVGTRFFGDIAYRRVFGSF